MCARLPYDVPAGHLKGPVRSFDGRQEEQPQEIDYRETHCQCESLGGNESNQREGVHTGAVSKVSLTLTIFFPRVLKFC